MKANIALLLASFAAVGPTLLAETLDVTSGGVGIGISTPSHKLEIDNLPSGNNNFTTDGVRVSTGTSTNVHGFKLMGGTSGTSEIATLSNTDGTNYVGWLNLFRDGTRKVQINASPGYPTFFNSGGNVAVGTDTPGKKFEVVGEIVARNSAGSSGQAGLMEVGSDGLHFWINNSYDPANPGSGWSKMMVLETSGNVGVGVASPSYKLEVNGSVRATSFVSNSTTYADFVFKPDYKLRSLAEVGAAIQRDGHLPDIPSEVEVKAHGVDLAKQQAKLLQKVEELTLYLIEHEKSLAGLRQENTELRQQLQKLRSQ